MYIFTLPGINTYIHKHTYIYIYVYKFIYVGVYVCMYLWMEVCKHRHTHTHIYIYTTYIKNLNQILDIDTKILHINEASYNWIYKMF